MRSAILLLLLGTALCAQTNSATPPVDFDRDVRPLLSAHCFRCHGPDASGRQGDLRLDLKSAALDPQRAPRAIVPGDAAASEVVKRLLHTDPEERMPPPSAHATLSDAERRLIARWIDEGASWTEHWAFEAPKAVDVPVVEDAGWSRGPIDRFLLARMQAAGLRPEPEASKETLIRRLSLDLRGLPPTPKEVASFLADTSEDAWEKLVDRFLAAPEYAEHQGRLWLDLARYGDTHGLHLDNYREAWPYRDWVVNAFARDLPYDQFVTQQLAGDLLPNATLDQLVASGFNRCHVTTNEGGSITEEVYVRNVVDRVNTFGTVFLGLTVGCANCHDHKFDPLTQKEYYELFAFFNNVDGSPMDGNAARHAPVVAVPSATQEEKKRELKAKLTALDEETERAAEGVELEAPFQPAYPPSQYKEVVWVDDAFPQGATPEGNDLQWIESPKELVRSGRFAMIREADGLEQHFFANADRKLRVATGDRLFCHVYIDPKNPPRSLMLQWNGDGNRDWEHRVYWGENVIPFGRDEAPSRIRMGPLPETGRWVRLEVPAENLGFMEGSVIHGMAFTQHGGRVAWDRAGIVSAWPQTPIDRPWIDDDTPVGASRHGDGGTTWHFVSGKTGAFPVLSGEKSLRRSGGDGLNQDYVIDARDPLVLQRGDRLFAHVWLDPDDPPRSVQLQFNDGNWNHRVRLGDPAHGAGARGGADFRLGDLPEAGRWHRIEVDLKSVGLKPGSRINGWAFTQVGGTVYWDRAGVRSWATNNERHLHDQGVWERVARNDKKLPSNIRSALATAKAKRSAAQLRSLHLHFLREVAKPLREKMKPLRERAQKLRGELAALESSIPRTPIMKERKKPRQAYLLRRGQYDLRGEKLGRSTPAMLPPMDPALPSDRLGLARWLCDPKHPLTARVAVNRLWQLIFGTGLVRTSEDFGNQGERPSHPELLDWLARRFVSEGWSVKGLLREMVCSSTYRQGSRQDQRKRKIDPDNRLLARAPRYRLDGEVLRDQALLLSDLLVSKLGGPSVKPPQPAGLWKVVAYVGSNTQSFKADRGPEKVHRRSLYTFWKRTAPPPQFTTFDAPSRESCVARRERTNTPLQALLLMNDPQYVEAARALAVFMLRSSHRDDEARVAALFRRCTCREASARERELLLAALADHRKAFTADPEAARKLLAIGEAPLPDPKEKFDVAEIAAWTMLANLVLNLDEVVTRS